VPGVQIELLVSSDVGCPHDYSLRADDAKKVADADLIVSNGLGLEPFLPVGNETDPKNDITAKLITLSDDCNVIEEQHDHADHNHEGHDHAEHDHAHDVNPHVWVSPREAIKQVQTLARKLAARDPAHARTYEENAAAYVRRLGDLRDRYAAAAPGFKHHDIVTFHDAFAYLARDLKLNVVATLTQDPEHAPSAREIAATIDTIRSTHAAAIFYEPAYARTLAATISSETSVPLFPLNPFNSIQSAPTKTSYEEVMDKNLQTLQQALGGTP
jgi:ABC-type Zn uptake system ZnuABC Zn-binding protein ZnuA